MVFWGGGSSLRRHLKLLKNLCHQFLFVLKHCKGPFTVSRAISVCVCDLVWVQCRLIVLFTVSATLTLTSTPTVDGPWEITNRVQINVSEANTKQSYSANVICYVHNTTSLFYHDHCYSQKTALPAINVLSYTFCLCTTQGHERG